MKMMSNLGHFRALETPGGKLGFQGSILGPKIGRKGSFGPPLGDVFWILLGYAFELLFWKASGSRFDDFGMILGSCWGSFS